MPYQKTTLVLALLGLLALDSGDRLTVDAREPGQLLVLSGGYPRAFFCAQRRSGRESECHATIVGSPLSLG